MQLSLSTDVANNAGLVGDRSAAFSQAQLISTSLISNSDATVSSVGAPDSSSATPGFVSSSGGRVSFKENSLAEYIDAVLKLDFDSSLTTTSTDQDALGGDAKQALSLNEIAHSIVSRKNRMLVVN